MRPGSAAAWPSVVRSLIDAGAHGPELLAEQAVLAASSVTGSTAAALVRWSEQPQVIRADGNISGLLVSRPPEGASLIGGRPVASAHVGADTDLVVLRLEGSQQFGLRDLETLRTVALLVALAGEQTGHALAALYDVATKILASLELDENLLSVAQTATRMLRAEIAGIFLLDANGDLQMRSAAGHRTVATAKLHIKRGQGVAGKVLETGRPQRSDDYLTDTSISREFLAAANDEGTQSALCVPMEGPGNKVVGVLCVWRRRRAPFTDVDERVLAALAHVATVAVVNARLYEEQRAAVQQLRLANQELERRYEATVRALRIHEELTRIAAEGDDLEAVVRVVNSLTGGDVALVSDDGRVLAAWPLEAREELPPMLELRRQQSAKKVEVDALSQPVIGQGERQLLVAPVRAAGVGFGHLCLATGEGIDTAGASVAAEQAATVCALLLAREEAAVSATRRLQAEFVWDLLEGRMPSETATLVRARHLSYGFQLPARLLLVAADGLEARARAEGWTAEELERQRLRVAHGIENQLREATMTRPIVVGRADLFAVIVPRVADEHLVSAWQLGKFAVDGVSAPRLRVATGVSGTVDTVSRFPEAFKEARLALSAASLPNEPVVLFEELGVLRFLLAPGSGEELDAFARRILGSLISYDEAHGASLVQTLEAYLEADCNLQRAAERLYIHHKTLRYRLQRIQLLAGLRMDRQDDRFNVMLALKVLRLREREPVGVQPPSLLVGSSSR